VGQRRSSPRNQPLGVVLRLCKSTSVRVCLSLPVLGTGVADQNDLVGYAVLVIGGTGVYAVDVVYAATDGPFLDDAETHFGRERV